MKVYFSSGIGEPGKRGTPGVYQPGPMSFSYRERAYVIPGVWRFPKGFVWDLLSFPEEGELEAFYRLCTQRAEQDTPISEAEEEQLRQAHPFQFLHPNAILVNGLPAENWSCSARLFGSVSWEEGSSDMEPVLRDAYPEQLAAAPCFGCQRFCVEAPKGTGKRTQLTALSFTFQPQPEKVLLTNLVFRYSMDRGGPQSFSFQHPVTGVTHQLHLQQVQQQKLTQLFRFAPVALTLGQYELDPPLPEGQTLQFSAQLPEDVQRPFSRDEASAIGIIGGADGPTAILLSQPECACPGANGLPLHHCQAQPSLNWPEPFPEFVPEFLLLPPDPETTVCLSPQDHPA